jgi:TM2 domain-containing membrane protein YozV
MSRDLLVRERSFNPVIAGLLSFFIPGLGQLYKGQFLRALLWFVLTPAGYWLFIIPGIVLHILCVLGAVMGSAGRDRIRVG